MKLCSTTRRHPGGSRGYPVIGSNAVHTRSISLLCLRKELVYQRDIQATQGHQRKYSRDADCPTCGPVYNVDLFRPDAPLLFLEEMTSAW
jgi:hypothetical protein